MQLLTFRVKPSAARLPFRQSVVYPCPGVTLRRSLGTAPHVEQGPQLLTITRSTRPQLALCQASREQGSPSTLKNRLSTLTNSRIYSWGLSGIVLLALGALCDAGFSGDWSRQGVLTHEQEATARNAFLGVSLFHLACTAAAYRIASDRGMSQIKYPTKVLAVGFPALLELLLKEPGTSEY